MSLQRLKDTTRVLQRPIAFWVAQPFPFVEPAFRVVSALIFVPTREVAVLILFGIAKFRPQDAGSIRVMNDVIAKEEIVFDNVSNQRAEKYNVSAGPNGHPNVRQRARARESWIDMNDRRSALFRLHHPAKADWVRL